jgi:transporter family protein
MRFIRLKLEEFYLSPNEFQVARPIQMLPEQFAIAFVFIKPRMKYMWIVFALLAAATAGGAVVLTKVGLKDLDSSLAFALQSILILFTAWTVIAFQGNWKEIAPITGRIWFFIIAAGILTASSSLLSYKALKLGEASYVTALERLSLVFSVILAVIFLKDRLTWQSILGIILMLSGAVLVALTNKQGS